MENSKHLVVRIMPVHITFVFDQKVMVKIFVDLMSRSDQSAQLGVSRTSTSTFGSKVLPGLFQEAAAATFLHHSLFQSMESIGRS